jgi:hypothetical protein
LNDLLIGQDGDDHFLGLSGDDLLIGRGGADSLQGGDGNDVLKGGAGNDTAVYTGNRDAYNIPGAASGTVSGPEGTDTLIDIERYQFSDKNLAFDLQVDQAAGNTLRIIGAAFDAPAIQQHPDWVGIGLELFDSGMSMQAVCEVVTQMLALSNADLVTTLYTNVVGSAPADAVRDSYAGLLQGSGGAMTQAELLVLAANAAVNEQNINLVGLQQAGVEFI